MVIIFQLFFIQYTYAFNLFSLGRLKNSFFRRPNFLISNIDISEAQNYSQVRSEDLKSQTKVITGSGTALTIAPGYTFTLSSPPRIRHPIPNIRFEASCSPYNILI